MCGDYAAVYGVCVCVCVCVCCVGTVIVGVCNTVYMCANVQDRMPVASATQFLMLIREYSLLQHLCNTKNRAHKPQYCGLCALFLVLLIVCTCVNDRVILILFTHVHTISRSVAL